MAESKTPEVCPGCFEAPRSRGRCPRCGFDADAPRPPTALAPGTLLNGQFSVGRVLGRPGGFGITYLAFDLQLETTVAVKEYLPRDLAARGTDGDTVLPHGSDEGELFRYGLGQFLTEARTLAKLDHPNIVRVRQFFAANASAYLVMGYYRGTTLADYLDTLPGGRMPEDKALALLLPILDGLRAVHAKDFLHRDIKPANIYLAQTDSGGVRPILLDFGAARQVLAERSRAVTTVLTPGYAPFEQYHGKGRQGPWTDVYAAAAVLYRMLTGAEPPEATARMEEDELHSAAAQGVSPQTAQALEAALAVRAADRTWDVDSFQQHLQRIKDADRRELQKPAAPEMPNTSAFPVVSRTDLDSEGEQAQDAPQAGMKQPQERCNPPKRRGLHYILKLRFLGAQDARYGLLLLLTLPLTVLLFIQLGYGMFGVLWVTSDLEIGQEFAIPTAFAIISLALSYFMRNAFAEFHQIRYAGFWGGAFLSNWFFLPLLTLADLVLAIELKVVPWLVAGTGLLGFDYYGDSDLALLTTVALSFWFVSGVLLSVPGKARGVFLFGFAVNIAFCVLLTLMASTAAIRLFSADRGSPLVDSGLAEEAWLALVAAVYLAIASLYAFTPASLVRRSHARGKNPAEAK
jgi:serine/threonine protein kinase